MREILFRGKTKTIAGSPYNNGKADGEWVRGYLYNDVGCYKVRQFETDYADYIPYEVDPETVGQYTGIADKNGTKIFDGDIVKTKTGRLCKVYWFNSPNMCGWDLKPIECNNPAPSEYDLFLSQNLEVVGNIHDNPDLVRGVV